MRSSRRLLTIVAFTLAGPVFACPVIETRTPQERCREAREILSEISDASLEQVWEKIDSPDLPDLHAIGDPEDDTYETCRHALLRDWERLTGRTDDVRIVAAMLEVADLADAPLLIPGLRRALRHPSASIRRRAARAISDSHDQVLAREIEARFEVETDDGVRRDLALALAATGSRRFLDELRRWVERGDPASRRVALRALLAAPDPASVAVLEAALEADDRRDPTNDIVSALASWREIPGARDALIRIGRFGPGTATMIVMTRLGTGDDPDVEALRDIAGARAEQGETSLQRHAESLIESLRTAPIETREHVPSGCSGGYPSLPLASGSFEEFDGYDVRYVAPASRADSARCWIAPGFLWQGSIGPRLSRGRPVTIADEFEWDGERWLAVETDDAMCWIAEHDLENEATPLDRRSRLEVDLPRDDAMSWAARTLEQQGWLRWIETDESFVTVRLEPEAGDAETIGTLQAVMLHADSDDTAILIRRWLRQFAQLDLLDPAEFPVEGQVDVEGGGDWGEVDDFLREVP